METRLILQTDPRLKARPQIHDYGCYLMCLCFLANKYAGALMGVDEITVLYDKLTKIELKAMSANCYILDPVKVLRKIGWEQVRKVSKEGPGYIPRGEEAAIELWTMTRPETGGQWRHFVTGSYDPFGLSETRRYGQLDSLRVFRYQ